MTTQNVPDGFHHVVCAVCGADVPRTRWETPLGLEPEEDISSFFSCTNAHYRRFGRIVECGECGLLYREPQETDLLALYSEGIDEGYLKEWPARRDTFERSFRQLHSFIRPPGDLLDVGCATGFGLRVAQELGWRPVGLEPGRWAARQARRQGLVVVGGTVDNCPFADEQFDVVTLWDVIEHVPDPGAMLCAIYDVLRPGGVVALTTMDMGSLVARALGARWPHLMRMHLWYFGFRHVVSLLSDAGFTAPQRRPHVRVLSASYLASRFEALGSRPSRALARLLAVPGLGRLHIPIRLGDLMAVYAFKPETATEARG